MSIPLLDAWFANRFVQRIAHKAAFALAMLLCIAWSTASALRPVTPVAPIAAFDAPMPMLHPPADCFHALGHGLAQARLERDAHARLWRCVVAGRAGSAKLRVGERIVAADGIAFTDTSAWYGAALSGRSTGPWQAVALVQKVE